MKVRQPGLQAVLVVAAIAVGIAAVLSVRDTRTWGTTYGGASAVAALADLAAGLGLMAAGLLVGSERSHRRMGLIVTLAGVAWLASDLVGWQGGPSLVRSVAAVVAMFFVPLTLDVVAVAPGRHAPSLWMRAMVVAGYGVAAVVSAGLAVVRDPTVEATCWNWCSSNLLRVIERPELAAALIDGWVVLSIVGGLVDRGGRERASRHRVACRAPDAVADPGAQPLGRRDHRGPFPGAPARHHRRSAEAGVRPPLPGRGVVRRGARGRPRLGRVPRASGAHLRGAARVRPRRGTPTGVRGGRAVARDGRLEPDGGLLAARLQGTTSTGLGPSSTLRRRDLAGRSRPSSEQDTRSPSSATTQRSIGPAGLDDQIGAAARLAIENERLQSEGPRAGA